ALASAAVSPSRRTGRSLPRRARGTRPATPADAGFFRGFAQGSQVNNTPAAAPRFPSRFARRPRNVSGLREIGGLEQPRTPRGHAALRSRSPDETRTVGPRTTTPAWLAPQPSQQDSSFRYLHQDGCAEIHDTEPAEHDN